MIKSSALVWVYGKQLFWTYHLSIHHLTAEHCDICIVCSFVVLMMLLWQSCPELLDILKVGRFDELKNHLDALVALYNVDGDKCVSLIIYHFIIIYYYCVISVGHLLEMSCTNVLQQLLLVTTPNWTVFVGSWKNKCTQQFRRWKLIFHHSINCQGMRNIWYISAVMVPIRLVPNKSWRNQFSKPGIYRNGKTSHVMHTFSPN